MVFRCLALIAAFVLTFITFLTLVFSWFSNDLIIYRSEYGNYTSGLFMGCVYNGTEDHCDTDLVYMKQASFTKKIASGSDPKKYQENIIKMIKSVMINQTVDNTYTDPNNTPSPKNGNHDTSLDDFVKRSLNYMGVQQSPQAFNILLRDTKKKLIEVATNPKLIKTTFVDFKDTFFSIFSANKTLTSAGYLVPAGRVGSITMAKITKATEGSFQIVLARVFSFISVALIICVLPYIVLKLIFTIPKHVSHFLIIQCVTTAISLFIFVNYAVQDIKKIQGGVQVLFSQGFFICCVSFGSSILAYVIVILSDFLL